ncbi:MAG TPA: tetratricopeptide repeat protein, partial [Bacteroidales bacterium]|nr:tetratricopeptide repeat protein [Bacteroidales bacterium]
MKHFLFVAAFVYSLSLFAQQSANDYYDAGTAKLNAKDYAGAIPLFTKCIEISPYYYEAYVDRGRCQFALGKKDLALADYNMALTKKKDFYFAFYYRALWYKDAKQMKEAMADITQAVNIRPKSADPYILRAAWYAEQNNNDASLADYNKILEIRPDDPATLVSRGKIYFNKDMQEQAFNDFSKVIDKNKTYGEAYYWRGVLLENIERFQVAIEDYTAAIN